MSKVTINRNNKERILLTELLPFEVPMLFSNEGFYSLIVSKKYNYFFDRISELSGATKDREKRKYGIPFNYEIKKTIDGETRTLSIIHPYNQFYFIELYSKYDTLMIHLCSKSQFSLRHISKIAKFYYKPEFVFEEEPLRMNNREVEPDFLDKETKYLKSYFTYEPIDLIYKFFDRHEYQRLEQRFNYLMEFDISKCFYNIYTHSITWAIKDKESAKRNSNKTSFENSFDKLMQLANYNETNGIVVGPEISRIFAEIILQQIDINVLNKTEKYYVYGVDFEIRRYVDDYFVFSNDERILDFVQKIFTKELEYYKLYINKSKIKRSLTPFIKDLAVGKRELKNTLSSLFDSIIIKSASEEIEESKNLNINYIRKPYVISQNFIKDFQCITKRNGLTYDNLSQDIIRYIKSKIVFILKNENIAKDPQNIENFLLMILDILFYSFSLNITSNATFKLSQIIVIISKYLKDKNEDLKQTIFSKIIRDADFTLTNFKRKSKHNETNIEILNLLIALKSLDTWCLFTEKRLIELFELNIKNTNSTLNYFQIITLLYYIDNKNQYNELRKYIEGSTINKFQNDLDPFSKSELTMLFFDFICCPFVSKRAKVKVIQATKYSTNPSLTFIENKIKEIEEQRKWFMDWDIEIDLEQVLKKKEWSTSY